MDSALIVDQSSITGENDPVEKNLGDTCYVTTGVKRGDAYLIVIGTGYQTFVGRIVDMIGEPLPDHQSRRKRQKTRHVSEYDDLLRDIGGFICLTIIAVMASCRFCGDVANSLHQIMELFTCLIIIAIPISREIFVSIIRSNGVGRLSEDGVLVQGQTSDSESLAGIDILCCDKTGTITENHPKMQEPYCLSCDPEVLTLVANLSSSPDKTTLDPIEQAIATALEKYPQAKAVMDQYEVLEHQPFDVETKRIQSLVKSPTDERILCVKGAPRALLETCFKDQLGGKDIKKAFRDKAQEFASRGFRCLAIARRVENHDWELLGLIALYDPPRPDTSSAIAIANVLGVSVKMCTGDATTIARSLAQEVGIGGNILDADSIDDGEEKQSEKAITTRIEAANVYAEILQSHKDKIVRLLQSHGRRVAAAGDGTADAQVLRRADCGIAVSGATEKAQSASNLVFAKAGLAPMIRCLQTSRQVFQQVYDYIFYRTTVSLHLIIVMLWYFVAYSEVLDGRLLLFNTHVSDIVTLSLTSDHTNLPFLKSPQRWSFRKLMADTLPLSLMLAIGSWLSVQGLGTSISYSPSANPKDVSVIRAQTLHLHMVLSTHWMPLVIYSVGYFRAALQNWRLLATLLSIDLLATALCFASWVGQGPDAGVTVASSAWLGSVITFGMMATYRWIIPKDELLDRALVIDGETAK